MSFQANAKRATAFSRLAVIFDRVSVASQPISLIPHKETVESPATAIALNETGQFKQMCAAIGKMNGDSSRGKSKGIPAGSRMPKRENNKPPLLDRSL